VTGQEADRPRPKSSRLTFFVEAVGKPRWIPDAKKIALAANGREVAGRQAVA
jgi:hypothetical protein